jgi:hypothetical protein
VAGAAEGELDGARLARQDEARRAHAAGDEDGLADLTIRLRDLGRTGRKSACRSLPVDEQLAPAVSLGLGDVVRDVVDLPRALGAFRSQHPVDRGADGVGDRLAVGPREVGGRGHGREVGASLRRRGGRAGELAIG